MYNELLSGVEKTTAQMCCIEVRFVLRIKKFQCTKQRICWPMSGDLGMLDRLPCIQVIDLDLSHSSLGGMAVNMNKTRRVFDAMTLSRVYRYSEKQYHVSSNLSTCNKSEVIQQLETQGYRLYSLPPILFGVVQQRQSLSASHAKRRSCCQW